MIISVLFRCYLNWFQNILPAGWKGTKQFNFKGFKMRKTISSCIFLSQRINPSMVHLEVPIVTLNSLVLVSL